MDIESKEVFEEALAEFPGTAVIVSHDRYFLQKIPDRILELTPDGMVEYLGKYDYYMEKKDRIESGKKYLESMASSEKQEGGAGENDREKALSPEEQRRLNKEREAEERRRTRRREALEEELAGIEEEIAGLSERISRPENAADYKLLSELSEQLTEAKARSEELMEEWLALD